MKVLLMVLFINPSGDITQVKHSEHNSYFNCHVTKSKQHETDNIKFKCINSLLVKN